ncbi:uncharacterized protein RSE6_14525 [Rhynchosporium secalis]|uniref:Uncharacterized protein n=1 Tax=Rhynchosporium secalis TaxID=38038 RepID=A0A1E1MW44_RHYSE|nr:uncharacterized protein RSE6_14525 [Rhynchosporium secalis]
MLIFEASTPSPAKLATAVEGRITVDKEMIFSSGNVTVANPDATSAKITSCPFRGGTVLHKNEQSLAADASHILAGHVSTTRQTWLPIPTQPSSRDFMHYRKQTDPANWQIPTTSLANWSSEDPVLEIVP